jgi:hypothetical protein
MALHNSYWVKGGTVSFFILMVPVVLGLFITLFSDFGRGILLFLAPDVYWISVSHDANPLSMLDWSQFILGAIVIRVLPGAFIGAIYGEYFASEGNKHTLNEFGIKSSKGKRK